MNTIQRPLRATMRQPHPIEYARRRLASLTIVGAALVGVLSTAAAEGAGLPHTWALAAGLATFAGLSAIMSDLEPRWMRRVTVGVAGRDSTSMQLGPDPEQVIGRRTGARI